MPSDANDKGALEWSEGINLSSELSTTPFTQAVISPGKFSGSGHPYAVQAMAGQFGLYTLLGNVTLATLAFLMLCLAAFVAVFVPDARAWIIPWFAIPSCVLAFGLGGFAVFRIVAPGGWQLTGGATPRTPGAKRGGRKPPPAIEDT
jgi:hypothetical protein